jgi:acyl-CoA dehydrogenase
MSMLLECVGAKGFESDTYFEMALRDIQLIPRLEGSTHLNFALAAEFVPKYFGNGKPDLEEIGTATGEENPYLAEARNSALHTIEFPHFSKAFEPLLAIRNVRTFARQAAALARFASRREPQPSRDPSVITQLLGQSLATVAYGQLIAESCVRLNLPTEMTSSIFHCLVGDFSRLALRLASEADVEEPTAPPKLRSGARGMIAFPSHIENDRAWAWQYVEMLGTTTI